MVDLPLELQQRIVDLAVCDLLKDEWQMRKTTRHAAALRYNTVSKGFYPIVNRRVYENIRIGDILNASQTRRLATSFEAHPALASATRTLDLRAFRTKQFVFAPSWKDSVLRILRLCSPERLFLNLPDHHHAEILSSIQADKLCQLNLTWRESIVPDYVALLDLFGRAAPTLEWLMISGLAPPSGLTFEAAQIPLMPKLNRFQIPDQLVLKMPASSRPQRDTSFYQAIIARHAHNLEILDITPLQYSSTKLLGELGSFPLLGILFMGYPAPPNKSRAYLLQHNYEWRLLDTLSVLSPCIYRLQFSAPQTLPEDPLQYTPFVEMCTHFMQQENFLPNLWRLIAADETDSVQFPNRQRHFNMGNFKKSYDKLSELCMERDVELVFRIPEVYFYGEEEYDEDSD